MTLWGQHSPSTLESHSLGMGRHWTKVKRALRPRNRLTVTMMNQTSLRTQPVETRSSVMAKAVLLQAAATMEHTPVTLATRL